MPSLYFSCPPHYSFNVRASSTQLYLCTSTPSGVPHSVNGFFDRSTPSATNTEVPVGSNSRGFFSNNGAVAVTFIMAIIELGLLIVLLYVCRGQYKKKKRQQALARNMHAPNWPHSYEIPITVDPFPLPNPPESIAVISRQNSWKRHPYAASTEDEHEMEHTEDVLSAQEYDMRRGNFWGDSLYELVRPRSVGINPGNAVTHSNRDSEDPLVHRQYQPKAEQIPHGVSIPRAHHSSIITPSRAYLPFSGWRHIPETASSPSAYPATLSVEADDEVDGESDHRLPTPTSITRPTAAAFPNQSYSWDASANESRSYRVFVEPDTRTIIPSDPGSDRGSRTASWQYPPSDGTRHSSPPPIPSRNPFRRVTWTRTTPNVRESEAE